MRDALDSLVTEINEALWEKRKRDYDRANDFYIDGKTDDEVYVIAHTLVKISRFSEDRTHGDTNKGRKENLLKELENIEKKLYTLGFVDEAIDHIRPVMAKIKRSKIESEKQQILSIANYVEKELLSIGSSAGTIKEIVTFIKKALPEVARYREDYKDELDKIEALI